MNDKVKQHCLVVHTEVQYVAVRNLHQRTNGTIDSKGGDEDGELLGSVGVLHTS